jgi:Zn-finger nucleic acid-binding protein
MVRCAQDMAARHGLAAMLGTVSQHAGSLMNCPKCEIRLDQIYLRDVPIEKCSKCEGIWLDKGELELIAEHERAEEGWLSKIMRQMGSKKTAE